MIRSFTAGAACLLAASAAAQTIPMPGPITGATCVSTGTVVVEKTIRITGGTYDGGCKTYVPGLSMDLNSHSETVAAQSLLFRVENGARLRNVIISHLPTRSNTARAINVYAGATLENIDIKKVFGELAISIKTAGIVNITRITSADSADRHINAIGVNTRVNISNCIFRNARKVYRQNGGTTYPTHVSITNCDISGMTDEVFRTDSPHSTATLSNSRLRAVPKICTGYAEGKCIVSGMVPY